MFGIAFYGENGTLVIDGGGYRIYDPQGKEVRNVPGPGSDTFHLQNFLDCVRSGSRPNADIKEGHKSTLLCHLGNIAWRTGHTLHLDPKTHTLYLVATDHGTITVYAQNSDAAARQAAPGDAVVLSFAPEAAFVVESEEVKR